MTHALRRGAVVGSVALAITGGVCLVEAAQALASTGYTISRYAGIEGSPGGFTAGAAVNSELSFVVSDGLDAAGNLYIVDPNNVAVEKVAADGTLSDFAGTGQSGPPTPGQAANSTLNNPAGVAADPAGNVFIADQNNNVVEKVTPDGTLSIFAGIPGNAGSPTEGAATGSHLNNPWAVATDGAGNVYIADNGNDVVEKVTPDGQLSIIAGIPGSSGNPTPGLATNSKLNQADGVAVDAAGNVYIDDEGAKVIEKVTPDEQLSIFAGTSGTSAPPTPGLATGSALDDPYGVAVDAAGAVYVADTGANVIEKITPDQQLSVIAGNGFGGHPTYGGLATATSLDLPLGMAVDPEGNVYVADAANYTIDRLTPPPPVSTADPVISGTVQAGQTVTTDGGSWDNTPVTETYRWQDCDGNGAGCTAIPGATGASYAVSAADGGHTLRVVVTATNGGGSADATSAAVTVISDSGPGNSGGGNPNVPPTTTTTGTTTTTPAPGPLVVTTAPVGSGSGSPPVKPLTATLGGSMSPSTAPVTYHFEYGTGSAYGSATASSALPASSTAQVVHANLRGLIPGTVYHYRLVVTTPSGTSYGQDETLTTPKAKLRRVRDHITPYRQTHAPYRYRLHGWMVRPDGLTSSVACKSGGPATLSVVRNARVLVERPLRVHRDCTYDTTIMFSAAQLPGDGRLLFRIGFGGNRQLLARPARTLKVLFG